MINTIYICIAIGLALSLVDILFLTKTLKGNIGKRIVYIISGIVCLYFIEPRYLKLTKEALIIGVSIGLIFMITHVIISKGINLRLKDVNRGLIATSFLIYFIELPAEELLYRGILLIPIMTILNPVIGIIISSLLFSLLHFKTWDDNFVKIGSLFLGMTCAITVYLTNSMWTAIIIHNLNDFGFLTLVNKRNIFSSRK